MANDIDMWNDIESLEKTKNLKKQAEHLHKVYLCWFINNDEEETIIAIQQAKKEFPDFPFDFEGYGININGV